jgi:DNA-binding transcriptional regulator YiaG
MSAHTKTRHIKVTKVLCVSEQGQVYKLPQSVLRKYVVHDNMSVKKAKNNIRHSLSVTPEEAFAEINAKYTKTGALLKAVRLREGLNQKDFAELINVTQGDLSKMEHGKRPVGKILVERIAKKFKSKIA